MCQETAVEVIGRVERVATLSVLSNLTSTSSGDGDARNAQVFFIPVLVVIDRIESCSLEIVILASDVGTNPAPIVIEIVVDIGDSKHVAGVKASPSVTEKEKLTLPTKSSDGMNSQSGVSVRVGISDQIHKRSATASSASLKLVSSCL